MRLFTGGWSIGINLLWWWLGGVAGYALGLSENYIYVYRDGKRGSLRIVKSVLFLLTWVFLALWSVTSVPSALGRGFIFGIGGFLVIELFYDYFYRREKMEMWFYQIKRKLDPKEIRIVVYFLMVIIGSLLLSL